MAKTPKAPRKPRKPKTDPRVPGADGMVATDHNQPPEMTEDQARALFLHHKQRYVTALEKKKASASAFLAVCKTFKAEGIPLAQIKHAIALESPEGEAEERLKIQQLIQAAVWMGSPLGTQFSMPDGPDRTPITDRARDEARMDFLENKPAKPTYSPDTEAYRAYMAQYHEMQDQRVTNGIKPMGEPTH